MRGRPHRQKRTARCRIAGRSDIPEMCKKYFTKYEKGVFFFPVRDATDKFSRNYRFRQAAVCHRNVALNNVPRIRAMLSGVSGSFINPFAGFVCNDKLFVLYSFVYTVRSRTQVLLLYTRRTQCAVRVRTKSKPYASISAHKLV